MGLTSGPGKGGHGDGGVDLVEKPWPEGLEVWVFIPSLPLICYVTLGKSLPLPGPGSPCHTIRSLEWLPEGTGVANQMGVAPGSALPHKHVLVSSEFEFLLQTRCGPRVLGLCL